LDAKFVRTSGLMQVDSIITDSILDVRQVLQAAGITYPLQINLKDGYDLTAGDGVSKLALKSAASIMALSAKVFGTVGSSNPKQNTTINKISIFIITPYVN
ncbi:unnamed protein product, partial [marine sediment metagenome]